MYSFLGPLCWLRLFQGRKALTKREIGNRGQPLIFLTAGTRDGNTFYIMAHLPRLWAYCLMDNHVHFVAIPSATDSLARCFSEAHVRYTRRINLRADDQEDFLKSVRRDSFVNRPLGDKAFVSDLEKRFQLRLARAKAGRPSQRGRENK